MKRLPFFVYGTLLPGQPNYDLWAGEITAAEPAIFPNGRLYDMGAYPLLLEDNGGPIKGQLVTIKKASYSMILHRLDALEGYNPRNPTDGSYRRVERTIQLPDNNFLPAWIYLGNPTMANDATLILSGNWARYTRKRREELETWWSRWRFGKSG